MKRLYPYLFFLFLCLSAQAQEFKVYQFPADKVPAIDGNTHDWDCVPADYKITETALKEDEGKHAQPDTGCNCMPAIYRMQKLRSCIFYMKHTIIIGGSVRTP